MPSADYANEYEHPAYGKVGITRDGEAFRCEVDPDRGTAGAAC
jgi:hypothetical protein